MANFNYDVIIPVYNASRTLEETLASVFSQTIKPNRVIVIDDVSTDCSKSIARNFDVLLLENKSKAYSGGSRNRGLLESNSKWIATIDSDDIWNSDAMEKLSQALESLELADVIGGLLTPFGDGMLEPYRRRNEKAEKGKVISEITFQDLLMGSPIAASSCLFKREALLEVGGWPTPNFAEDYHLLVKLFVSGKRLVKLNQVVGSYRLTLSQKSSQIGLQTESQINALEFLFERNPSPKLLRKTKIKVFFSYLARLHNSGRSFEKKDVPANLKNIKGATPIAFLISIFSIPLFWKVAGLCFQTFKVARAKIPRFHVRRE